MDYKPSFNLKGYPHLLKGLHTTRIGLDLTSANLQQFPEHLGGRKQ